MSSKTLAFVSAAFLVGALTAHAASEPVPAATSAPPETAAPAKAPAKRAATAPRRRAGPDADARKCLELTQNNEVIRCANAYL